MKRTHYRIMKKQTAAEPPQTEYGLIITNGKERITVFPLAPNRQTVLAMVRKLRPFNLSPAIAKEVLEDLIYSDSFPFVCKP